MICMYIYIYTHTNMFVYSCCKHICHISGSTTCHPLPQLLTSGHVRPLPIRTKRSNWGGTVGAPENLVIRDTGAKGGRTK